MGLEQQVSSLGNDWGLAVVEPDDRTRDNGDDEWMGGRLPIVGKSPSIRRCVELAKKAAASRSTVILLGESGTGKEVFARAIHSWSERRDRPFVAINCVGLARDLLESELFGHEKGAFTGAHQLKRGKMEVADRGSVLLDEIGDISLDLQNMLLRFLQEREFERVGGTRSIVVDVRIIAATNRDLSAQVRAETFRDDLYHRLNVISTTLPPLRERKEDVLELVQYFLSRSCKEAGRNFATISAPALKKLCAYSWPGNVRELANVVEHAIVLGQGPTINVADLPSRIDCQEWIQRSPGISYREAVNDFRRNLIAHALGQTRGNQAAAARMLGLHRKYLQRLIKTLDIS
jgi:transcriptional regulator with PAS, ATPase and Fis domain